ncbi:9824_t:CDS:2, partial [Entrophospora sp. SA101]
ILLVKNTDQVKKITQKEFSSSQTITFKVLGQKKTRKEEFGIGSYHHELEVEPFSLGIEGLPEISRISFCFGYAQSLENSPNSLMKTKLYNSKLLAESAGKTFTMKVKEWNVFDNNESLLFNETSDFDLDSFQEKSTNNPDQPVNNPPPNPPENDNSTTPSGNKGLILGTVIILIILVLIIGELVKGQKIKFCTNQQKVYQVDRVGVNIPHEALKDKLIAGEIG